MRIAANSLRAAAGLLLVALVAVDPAVAGVTPVPGPMIGAGAPAMALFGVGYWLIRRRRRQG
jgi:hypothetical protein